MKTGDVVEQRDHETFIWLDRVKNIIKLAQVGVPAIFAAPSVAVFFPVLTQ